MSTEMDSIKNYNLDKKTAMNQARNDDASRKYSNFMVNDGWMNILTGLGVRGRDKNTATVYRMCRQITVGELDELYRGDGFVKRIVDLPAFEMVRQGWEIEGDSDNVANLKMEELCTSQYLVDLIKWSRLYGGAVIVMGIADGRKLDEPVDEKNIRDVCWLRVFDRYQAFSRDGMFERDLASPNYGYPDVYEVTDNRTGNIFFVHHTRILRMDWSSMPPRFQNWNNGWGDSAIQSMYEELKNFSQTFANAGLIVHDFIISILKIPNLAEMLASQCNDQKIIQRANILNLAKSMTNTMILDKEEEYEKITSNIQNLPELLDRFMQTLSAVSGIPVTLLFGRSAAGLNATGDNDVRNFYDYVKQLQEHKLKPCLERLVKYIYLSEDGATKGVEPENWSIQFVPLWQNTEEQEALIRRTVAETDVMYLDRGVLTPAEVAVSRFGGDKWSMNTEIDLEAREGGYDAEELADLELKKKEEERKEDPEPTVGPDFVQSNISNPRREY